ncbi:MAG: hypothetical protein OXU36_10140 [Candidatus Poribacteria bacterium]|nr:hypothetical protein [Candidatus Poribacteria bacterium]
MVSTGFPEATSAAFRVSLGFDDSQKCRTPIALSTSLPGDALLTSRDFL